MIVLKLYMRLNRKYSRRIIYGLVSLFIFTGLVVDHTSNLFAKLLPTTFSDPSYSTDSATRPHPGGTVNVIRVVDGDTIIVDSDGKPETIRLIGINTPESVDPRRPVQCFGKEASMRAKELLGQSYVTVTPDPTQDTHDKYGRTLAYIFMPDGTNFNLKMISDGYAYEYTYHSAYQYQKEFKAAEADAKANNRGLWSPETCNGKK